MRVFLFYFMISLVVFFTNLSCKRKSEPEKPKIKNCIEAVCIYKQTCYQTGGPRFIYFKLIDTTQFKGSKILDRVLLLLPNLNISEFKQTDSGFLGSYYTDGHLADLYEKVIIGRKYFFEYDIPKSKYEFGSTAFKCQGMANDWEQLILLDTLTSNCTKIK
jgi:hypothetical protein